MTLNAAQDKNVSTPKNKKKPYCIQNRKRCQICNSQMNRASKAEEMWFCPECSTHEKNGVIYNVDVNGNLQEVGYQTRLRIVQNDGKKIAAKTPDEVPESNKQTVDLYFRSGDKKHFKDVEGTWPERNWIVLVQSGGKKNGNIDFYFLSGDKKKFENMTIKNFFGQWIVLAKENGGEISINSNNVNYFDDGEKIHINANNVNFMEEV